MKFIVCVKTVSDSEAHININDGNVDLSGASLILNPWDEYAIEAALQLKENHNGSVTALSLGNESAHVALRYALAMGVDEAIHLSGLAVDQLDSLSVARILAAAIQKYGDVDLVFFGRQTIDGESGLVPTQTARLLGWPALTSVSKLDLEGDQIRVERSFEEGRQTVLSGRPAAVSLTKDFSEPRFPTFMNKRKAERAEIPVWTLTDLGIDIPTSYLTWTGAEAAPERETACEMLTGTPDEIASQLIERLMAEKIL